LCCDELNNNYKIEDGTNIVVVIYMYLEEVMSDIYITAVNMLLYLFEIVSGGVLTV